MAYQRYTPTLSTCEVAKKSPVGEKDTLAATLAHRKPSSSLPVGMSNVLIVESREVAISQRESGENVYQAHNEQEGKGQWTEGRLTYNIENPCGESAQLPNEPPSFNVEDLDKEVVGDYGEEVAVSLQMYRDYRGRQDESFL